MTVAVTAKRRRRQMRLDKRFKRTGASSPVKTAATSSPSMTKKPTQKKKAA